LNKKILALSLSSGLTAGGRAALLKKRGSLAKVLKLSTAELKNYASAFKTARHTQAESDFEGWDYLLEKAEIVCKRCRQLDINIITLTDELYPLRLKQIYKPPWVLYYKGTLPPLFFNLQQRRHIAVVGTRRSTKYSESFTKTFCAAAAATDHHIISGMALGIDSAAHNGALLKGNTTAVLGSGLNIVYPRKNIPLYKKILNRNGCIISEHPPDTQPLAWHFPNRNRIVSGLSDYILMVHAPARSGALITVKYGLDQNKEILVFDDQTEHESYEGNKKLLRDGAAAIHSFRDFSRYTGCPMPPACQNRAGSASLSPKERSILAAAGSKPVSAAEIAAYIKQSVEKLPGQLFQMVTRGLLLEMPGQKYFTNNRNIPNGT